MCSLISWVGVLNSTEEKKKNASVFYLFPDILQNMTRYNKLLKPNLSNQGRLKLLEL